MLHVMRLKSQTGRIRMKDIRGEEHCQSFVICLWFLWSFVEVRRL